MDGSALARLTASQYAVVATPRPVVGGRAGADRRAAHRRRHGVQQPATDTLSACASCSWRARGRVYLIDPLRVPDLTPLRGLLEFPQFEKVLHGADYDLRGLHRDWGLTAVNLFDTYVAARLVGIEQVGLGALASSLLGVDPAQRGAHPEAGLVEAPASRRRRWTTRRPTWPTSARCGDALAERLAALGRREWAAEEFARLEQVRHQTPDPNRALFSFKEGRGLDGRGLAVLRSLLEMREAEARRIGRPPRVRDSQRGARRTSGEPGARHGRRAVDAACYGAQARREGKAGGEAGLGRAASAPPGAGAHPASTSDARGGGAG